jgi:uncharacterized membrane protein
MSTSLVEGIGYLPIAAGNNCSCGTGGAGTFNSESNPNGWEFVPTGNNLCTRYPNASQFEAMTPPATRNVPCDVARL